MDDEAAETKKEDEVITKKKSKKKRNKETVPVKREPLLLELDSILQALEVIYIVILYCVNTCVRYLYCGTVLY